jgi:CRISPR system Cascade subunit CasE
VFLTKLTIDVRSRTFRRDHGNIHDMHRTVMSAYPDMPEETPGRQAHGVLWRLDAARGGFVQYVQSHIEPDWTKLPAGHLAAPAEVRPLRPVLDAIATGRKLSFRLVANPTKCDPKTHKRIAHRQPEQQVEWLIRQGERHGFMIASAAGGVPDVAPLPIPSLVGRKDDRKKITVQPVRFDGHLVVTDADAFTDALLNGIGRAKAYGCGLISLAPPRTL